jgi:uncharacterized protein (TIGR02266 family)
VPAARKRSAVLGLALLAIGCGVLCALVVFHARSRLARVEGLLALGAMLSGAVVLVRARASARVRLQAIVTDPPQPRVLHVPDDAAITLRPARARAGASGPELRTSRRLDVNVEVGMGSDSNFYLGLSENLSEGGLFVATYRTLPVGTDVALTLKLPNHPAPIQVHGSVRWVRDAATDGQIPAGMGVRFERFDEAHVALIRKFIASRAPLFFDE